MKKFLALFLVICFALSLSGCSKNTDSTESEPTESRPTVAVDNSRPSFGTYEDQNYVNPFLGIGIDFPDGWVFVTESELLSLNEITETDEQKKAEAIAKAETLYLTFAQEAETYDSIKISAQKLGSEQTARLDMAAKLKELGDSTRETLEKMGATNVKNEISTAVIYGRELLISTTSSNFIGRNSIQTDFLLRCGDYVATVSVTTYTKTDILSYFYFL